jgi:RNA polymerase sigma-70 factor (ECF subfamily)
LTLNAPNPDEAAITNPLGFARLVEPLRPELRFHCYRMMGTIHDAEDLVQETLLRAWRSREAFEGERPLRHWLHRIATNACLDALARRKAVGRVLQLPDQAPSRGSPSGEPRLGAPWLEPFPDRMLEEIADGAPDPEARYQLAESVRFAFITAIQHLPARQRAAVLLRDVLGWSAEETTHALGGSVASVNSAVQRARATLTTLDLASTAARPPTAEDVALVERYASAWHARDLDGFVSLLSKDAVYRMPPWAEWYEGPASISNFFRRAWSRHGRFKLETVRANGQLGVAIYEELEGAFRAAMIQILTVEKGQITAITSWVEPLGAPLFSSFGLGLSHPGTV